MKRIVYFLFLILIVTSLIACKKKNSDNENNSVIKDYITYDITGVTKKPEPTTQPEDQIEVREGQVRSYITGLWIPEEIGNKRPYAIQFSNFKTVSNQSGIGQAGIVYEAIVEGGITRLLALFDTIEGKRIGSIRSSRHYFVSFADEYDSIYIHFGKTKYAVKKLKDLGIDNLDGETGIGNTVFYRDNSMKAPHNAFTSLEGILAGIEKKKFRTEYEEGYKPHYSFYQKDTDLSSETNVNKVTIKYSNYISPFFDYNATEKLYYRSQFGGPHKDAVTGDQLAFKNIIVQFVEQWDIDKNDYQTMKQDDASGKGYYITNGKLIPITWKKNEKLKWMRYYDEAGEELTINPGKTFISVFPDNRIKDIIIEN